MPSRSRVPSPLGMNEALCQLAKKSLYPQNGSGGTCAHSPVIGCQHRQSCGSDKVYIRNRGAVLCDAWAVKKWRRSMLS